MDEILVSRKPAIYWVVADVKVLPHAPNWAKDAERAMVQIVTHLAGSREFAEQQLKERLLPLGYELLGLEELMAFGDVYFLCDDVTWPNKEAWDCGRSLYLKLIQREGNLQFGKFSFYDEDEAEQDT